MKNPLMKEFVLPDYKNIKHGFIRDPTPSINPMLLTDKELREQPQIVKMACERFNVPEVLFNPSDIGINQAGLAEAVV